MSRNATTARGDARLRLKSLLDAGAFDEALRMARKILAVEKEDPTATAAITRCEDALRSRYLVKLGSMQAVPTSTRMPRGSVDLEPKAMFLLTHIDGVSTIEEIVDVSGVGELDTLRLLVCLVDNGYVVLG